MYDILIQNGLIIDGTGSPALRSEVAIKDGKIAKIARKITEGAETVIDAAGKVITPGFIDSHSHSDKQFFSCPLQTYKIEQGITTSIGGQCGGSVCGGDSAEFLDNARGVALGANLAMLIGHGSIRKAVMGMDNREPTPQELEDMKAITSDAMEHGALGVSFGMIYAPSCYAQTPEMIEIAKVVGQYHGIAAIHLRSEGIDLIRAVREFISVVRQSGVRGVISHHKVAGLQDNWGKVHTSLRMIEQANDEGLELYLDAYPYTASSTKFSSSLIPPAWHSRGVEGLLERMEDPAEIEQIRQEYYAKIPDLSHILLTYAPGAEEYSGMRVNEIAALRGQDQFLAAMDIVRMTKDSANACFFTMCEEDVETVLAYPRTMICTDSGTIVKATLFHPRGRAAFPRALGHYVRERKIVSLPEMIRKMTSMPAAVYGLKTKGLVREGFDADLCIFDPETIEDKATYSVPSLHNEGLSYVIVGGKIAVVDAVATGELGGTMLYRDL